jgi:hypothetical protein
LFENNKTGERGKDGEGDVMRVMTELGKSKTRLVSGEKRMINQRRKSDRNEHAWEVVQRHRP